VGKSSKKTTTTGYKYSMALHMGLCRGPIDEIIEIRVGDLTAWAGMIGGDSDVGVINAPELFGGSAKEGGITGGFSVLMGAADQHIAPRFVPVVGNGSIAGSMSIRDLMLAAGASLVPSFRGVCTLFFRGVLATNNPYPKPWKMRVRRSTQGWDGPCWYPEKAKVILENGTIHAMNPAHILYECVTNRAWGRGLSRDLIDDAAWASVANALCDEGFGLCIRWTRTDDLDAFMQGIINTIGGALLIDRETGLLVLRLLRADYVAADLPLFDAESGLLSVDGDDTGSGDGGFNEIVVTYRTPLNGGEERKIRAHNLAAKESAGAVISTTVDYSGIPTPDLASRVAVRDLQMQGSGLKRYTLKLDRRAWKLLPSSVFRISYPPRGIYDVILRVGKVEDSVHTDGTITVTAMQDVFGLPAAGFAVYQDPVWTPPDRTPYPVGNAALAEATYRDLIRTISPADMAQFDATSAAFVIYAAKPSALTVNYQMLVAVDGGAMEDEGEGGFTPTATLADAIGAYTTVVTFTDMERAGAVAAGQAVLIDGEIARIDEWDGATGQATIARGTVDTLPAAHAEAVRVWFIDAGGASDSAEYVAGETLTVKLLTNTTSSRLTEAEAPPLTLPLTGRQARPYPPGKLLVGVVPFASATAPVFGDLVLSWTHRDRLIEQHQLVAHEAASIGPEPGTTYTVRLYDGVTLLRTVAGIAGTTWTYDTPMAAADGNKHALTIELESVCNGLASFAHYSFPVQHYATGTYGFDYSFGNLFGGAP
jgi:hypothetical protein